MIIEKKIFKFDTRNTHAHTCASTQLNHRHLNKHKTQAQTHQQAQVQAHTQTQCEQQTHKNKNKHEYRHNHMCVSEESASAPTWIGRVHVGIVERRETESGRGGVRKGTGESLFGIHDHGGGTKRKKQHPQQAQKDDKDNIHNTAKIHSNKVTHY